MDLSPTWDGAIIDFSSSTDQIYVIEEEDSSNISRTVAWTPSPKPHYAGTLKTQLNHRIQYRSEKVNQDDQTHPEESSVCDVLLTPRAMDTPAMRIDVAVSFWFRHLVRIPRLPDALQGYMEILAPMYMKAMPSSLLHQATRALALAALSNGQKSALIRLEARKLYAKALRETGEAIRDPKQARSNELLMAIMLFSLYETITSSDNTRALWNQHINGAVTLVKMRGESMKSDSTSLHLFRAVRTHMVCLVPSWTVVQADGL